MHSHFGLQEQNLLAAPLIVRETSAIKSGIQEAVILLEDFSWTKPSTLLAELRKPKPAFLRSFWQQARASGRIRFVREIDLALPRVFRPSGGPTRDIQVEPLAMLNVDSHGNVSSFSPELLGLKNADYGDYILGNINSQSLTEIHQACLGSALYRDISAGVAACQANCDYFSVCGGGAPINKLFENGSFASTTTSYCTLTQMVPTDLILEAYDHLEQSWTDNDPAPFVQPKSHTTAEAAQLSPRLP